MPLTDQKKIFIMLQQIYILNKCCPLAFLIIEESRKKSITVSTKILSFQH